VITRGNTVFGYGIDIPASYVWLRNLSVRDAFRGFNIASHSSARVDRSLAYSNEYGIVLTAASNAVVVNDRLWNNRRGGVDVQSSSSTTVENCTFVGNVPFGFRTQNSPGGILQNNIFDVNSVTAAALAGSVTDSFIDYNVYFLETSSAIHSTNFSLLAWQLGTAHDYRSAVTNPLFANAASGDFHERSAAGRYVDGTGFVTDSVSSWAIDKGNPFSVFTNEPAPAGARINAGAYGNTEFASKGFTNVYAETRSLNDGPSISGTNSLWPLIWTAENIPTGETFRVQFSGDAGLSWTDLQSGVSPYIEVFLWQTSPLFNTYRGRWRVIGQNNSNLVAVNGAPFEISHGDFSVLSQGVSSGRLSQIVFRGWWGENYRVQFATDLVSTNAWFDAPTGPGANQSGAFYSTRGGDFLYEDVQSDTNRIRLYRVIHDQF
jgi:parallel beta-helix repeat protein